MRPPVTLLPSHELGEHKRTVTDSWPWTVAIDSALFLGACLTHFTCLRVFVCLRTGRICFGPEKNDCVQVCLSSFLFPFLIDVLSSALTTSQLSLTTSESEFSALSLQFKPRTFWHAGMIRNIPLWGFVQSLGKMTATQACRRYRVASQVVETEEIKV